MEVINRTKMIFMIKSFLLDKISPPPSAFPSIYAMSMG